MCVSTRIFARHGEIAKSYAYPVKVEGRYVMDPSPIPKFDNPKLGDCPRPAASSAPGASSASMRCRPIRVSRSLDFEDYPFKASKPDQPCALCGASDSYLDEVINGRCRHAHVRLLGYRLLPGERRDAGHRGLMAAPFAENGDAELPQ